MWQELVDQKDKWIGGTLKEFGDSTDRRIMKPELIGIETIIVDFVLTDDRFEVVGEDFSCCGARDYLGITGQPRFPVNGEGLAISGYGGWEFHITRK